MKLVCSALFIAILMVITSCKHEVPNNTMVVHILNEPTDLHPCNGSSALRSELNLYTQVSLLKTDYNTGHLIPCLAKQLPVISNDGLSFTFELNESVLWDDNSPILASDIAFTAKANKCLLTNNQNNKYYWENLKNIEIDPLNSKKFTVTMSKPYILNTWFWIDVPILQESFFDAQKTLSKYSYEQMADSVFLKTKNDIKQWADTFNSAKYYNNPQFLKGAGPYKITKWDNGVSLTLEKKANYWTKNCSGTLFCQAYADKIIFKINSNNASTKLDLKNGLIDVSTMVDFSTFNELNNDEVFSKKYIMTLDNTYNYLYVAMNMKPDGIKHKKIFNDVNVRKAMALLTPYDQINKIIYNNSCKRAIGPVSIFKTDFNENLKPIEFNINKSKELLLEAGWKDTDNNQVLDKIIDGKKVDFEITINFMATQKQWEDIAKQLAESMQKVNIYAKLNPVDYNGFVGAAMNHDFDMSIGAWQGSAQPEDFSQLWHSKSWITNGLNFTGFGTPQSDSLIDKINVSVDESKRIELSKQFQEMVYNEQPYVFLFSQLRRVVVSKKWSNIEVYDEYPGVLLNTLKLN